MAKAFASLMLQNGGFGVQTPYFAQTLSFVGGSESGFFRETKDTVRVSLQEDLFTGSSKVSSCGFWQKRVRLSGPPGGGFSSTPGTYLNSTLGFA